MRLEVHLRVWPQMLRFNSPPPMRSCVWRGGCLARIRDIYWRPTSVPGVCSHGQLRKGMRQWNMATV